MSSSNQQKKPYDHSLSSIYRGLLLLIVPITAYFLGLLPVITLLYYVLPLIPFQGFIYVLCLSILLLISFFLLLILETFIPGLFIRIFRIQVKKGTYERSIKDKGFFQHLLFFTLYRPALCFIGIFPFVPLRQAFLKLVGLKIGKGSLIAGTELIDEPYALSIGTNTLIGGYATIYTHLTFKKMREKPVQIGNNCFIGNKSVIMPGVIIEDDVILKPNTIVPEDTIIKKGKIYAGNPAKEIAANTNGG